MHERKQDYEYKTAPVDKAEDLETVLNTWSKAGWRYVGDYQSSGYTVRIILERPL